MHPFCGCDTEDVLQAGGLRLSDLFPESLGDFKPERRPFDPVQVLQAISHEIMVVCLIASDMGETGNSDQEQERRLATASQRLGNALTMIGELPVPDAIKRIRRAEAAPA
jgi:hypothetical protein